MKAMVFFIAVLMLALTLARCGGKAPEFLSPADGQTYQIEQMTRVDFTIKDYDRNVNITFRGQEVIADEVDCVGGPGIAYCQRKYTQGFNNYSYSQNCDTKHPCTITAVADDGKQKSIISIKIQRGGVQATPTKAN